jgi:cell division protein FtsQ
LGLLGCLITLLLLLGGWLWLRHSSLVAVRNVQVTGAQGPDAQAIESALEGAARHMSTLDVHPAALRAAVASFPVVSGLHVSAAFPHGLRIRVIEQPPVAALDAAGVRTAVAADGMVLGPALLSPSLPVLRGTAMPTTAQRLRSPATLAALTVIGAAPAALSNDLVRAFDGSMGLTLELRHGIRVYFGDASRPNAKWLSLARVLADPSSAGASYIDVRLPERPAAGFAPGAMPPLSTGTGANGSPGEEGASGEQPASGGAPPLAGAGLSSGEHSSAGEHSSSGEASPPGSERPGATAEEAAGPHG